MRLSIRNSLLHGGVGIIVCIATLLLFNWKNAGEPYLFIHDTATQERLNVSIASDQDTRMIFITRLVHNKPVAYLETFFLSAFRSLDPVFIFSLPGPTSMYESLDKIPMLYQFEFFVFIGSLIYLVRQWPQIKKSFWYLPYAFLLAIGICGLCMPMINTVKMLPLLILIRFVEVVGVFLFIETRVWSKK